MPREDIRTSYSHPKRPYASHKGSRPLGVDYCRAAGMSEKRISLFARKLGRSPRGASVYSAGLCLWAFGLIPDIDLTLRCLKIGWIERIKKPSRMVARFFQGRQ